MIEMFYRKTKCSLLANSKYGRENIPVLSSIIIILPVWQNTLSSFHSVLEICRMRRGCCFKSRCRDNFNYTLSFMKSTSKIGWSHKVKFKPDDNQRFKTENKWHFCTILCWILCWIIMGYEKKTNKRDRTSTASSVSSLNGEIEIS